MFGRGYLPLALSLLFYIVFCLIPCYYCYITKCILLGSVPIMLSLSSCFCLPIILKKIIIIYFSFCNSSPEILCWNLSNQQASRGVSGLCWINTVSGLLQVNCELWYGTWMWRVYLKVGGLGLLKLIQAKENFALEDGPTQPYIATRRFQKGTVLTM